MQTRLRSHAHDDPQRTALVDGQREVSYGELDSVSDQWARDLVALGVRGGDVVAVARASALTLISGLLATLKAGAACLIVDAVDGADVVEDLGGLGVKAIVQDDPERAVVLLADPVAGESASLPPASVGWLLHDAQHRKAVSCGERALSNHAQWTTETFAIPPGLRFGVLPCVNTHVLVQGIFTALWSGGTVCFPSCDRNRPHDLRQWLDREIAVAYGAPRTWRRLKKNGRVLPALRYAFFVGDVLVREDVARVRALAPAVTCAYFFARDDHPQHCACYPIPADASELREIVPVGRGIAGVELVVLNRNQQLAGTGELGELYFLGGPILESSARIDDGLVATGLAGRFLPDGTVDRVGDASHCGSIDGYTVRFDEIASVVMRHPDVLDAIIVLRKNGANAELVAYVTSGDERAWPGDALDRFLGHRLAAYMVPRHVVHIGPGTREASFSPPSP